MRVLVRHIAPIMGVTPEYIMAGLRAGKWDWGDAVKGRYSRKQYTYRIYWPKFKEWWGEDDSTRAIDKELNESEISQATI